jgi:hypothetical protein
MDCIALDGWVALVALHCQESKYSGQEVQEGGGARRVSQRCADADVIEALR